jgi:hypothetical protein|tara:strand:- start:18256 stop:18720 length:465 start_codon:yes stop_codon:yes gene_type:complete
MNTGAFEHFKKKKPFHHYLDGSYSYGQAPSSGYELAYRPGKPYDDGNPRQKAGMTAVGIGGQPNVAHAFQGYTIAETKDTQHYDNGISLSSPRVFFQNTPSNFGEGPQQGISSNDPDYYDKKFFPVLFFPARDTLSRQRGGIVLGAPVIWAQIC